MSLTIPLRDDLPHYDMQVDLDGVSYTLEFRWNSRESSWYMDIREDDGTPIRCGIKVVIDVSLTGRSRDVRMPKGLLVVIDTAGTGKSPGLNDLGTRVVIIYYEAAELAP